MWQSTISTRDLYGRIAIPCPPEHVPAPGQYLLAQGEGEADALLAVPLFPTDFLAPKGTLWCAPDTPSTWLPGVRLHLRGPLGRGINLPPHFRHLVLLALDNHPWRLMPLVAKALTRDAEVVLFADHLPSGLRLPAGVESLPLVAASEALHTWADAWAADLPLDRLEALNELLYAPDDRPPAAPGEVLVALPMPCGGLADCGVCTVSLSGETYLACKEGPCRPWKPSSRFVGR